jgi:plasmid stabilization system protein ParE
MKAVLSDAADTDLADASAFYALKSAALSNRFVDEFMSTLNRVENLPYAWQVLEADIRRCVFHVFPYCLVYQVRKNDILILSVSHLRREPSHWRHRLGSAEG